jgi:hypothetical protein
LRAELKCYGGYKEWIWLWRGGEELEVVNELIQKK